MRMVEARESAGGAGWTSIDEKNSVTRSAGTIGLRPGLISWNCTGDRIANCMSLRLVRLKSALH